jgi:outer membrane protein OmpA-like peptidoglycan-associated protein
MTYSRTQPTDQPTVPAVRGVFRFLLSLAAAAVYGCSTPAPPAPTALEKSTPALAAVAPPPPAEQVAAPTATEKPVDVIAEKNNVFFPPGLTLIDDTGNEKLRLHADQLKQNPKQRVTLRAYADDLGSRNVSLAIAEQRLTAVVKALRAYGASARQIRRNRVASVKKPVSCSSPRCRKPMGRVELVYSP